MNKELDRFTDKVCWKCKEERLKTALSNPEDPASKMILVCQNCGHQEFA
jgi:DNA-directed RNA polymerase subunit RPC12/RpoP